MTIEKQRIPRHPLIMGQPDLGFGGGKFVKALQECEVIPLGVYIMVRGSQLTVFDKDGRTGVSLKGVLNWAINQENKPAVMVNIAHEIDSESALAYADLAISLLHRLGKGLRFIIASADPAVITHINGLYRNVETALILKVESEQAIKSHPLKSCRGLGYKHLIIEKLTGEVNSDGLAELAGHAKQFHNMQLWVVTENLIAFASTLVDKKVGVISMCPIQVAQYAL